MVTQIITKLSVAKRKGKNVIYRSPRIYLSTKLTDDSKFPFKEGDILRIRNVNRRLIIEKYIMRKKIPKKRKNSINSKNRNKEQSNKMN